MRKWRREKVKKKEEKGGLRRGDKEARDTYSQYKREGCRPEGNPRAT